MRNILLGGLLALVVVGGFMALDRTVLHWYTEDLDSEPATEESLRDRMPAAIAEKLANEHMSDSLDSVPEAGMWPLCEADERTKDGWLVECGLQRTSDGRVFRQVRLYMVKDDGTVITPW